MVQRTTAYPEPKGSHIEQRHALVRMPFGASCRAPSVPRKRRDLGGLQLLANSEQLRLRPFIPHRILCPPLYHSALFLVG